MVNEIAPVALKARLTEQNAPVVLDVREDWEREIAALPGTLHIPMNQVSARLAEIPRDRDVVVMCRSGGRSLKVAGYLQGMGFRVANLTGGIVAWARDVDPTLPSY